MSDAGKSQEPSMEEILASIRRIIAEDEAGRSRAVGSAAGARPSTEGMSRGVRPPSRPVAAEAPARPQARAADSEMVLDLTNMVAADGSVVTIAPNPAQGQGFSSPPTPPGFVPPDQAPYSSGFSRRPPPPGPGAEPSGFSRPVAPPAPAAPLEAAPQPFAPQTFAPQPFASQPFAPMQSTDGPSRNLSQPSSAVMHPMPPNLSEDSPSRRVFKRRHQAGTAFAELAQTGYAAAPDRRTDFGQVPSGSVATELDMSSPPPDQAVASTGFQPTGYEAPSFQPTAYEPPPFQSDTAPAAPDFEQPPAFSEASDHYAPVMSPPPIEPLAEEAPPAAPAISEEQVRAIVGSEAEPIIRNWLEANLGKMLEARVAAAVQSALGPAVDAAMRAAVPPAAESAVQTALRPALETAVQDRVTKSMATLPEAIDQRIRSNVESNLNPYIEDRVGSHVDARLAAAVDEKVTAAVKQQVAIAVNQQIAQAVSTHVTSAVTQQLQGQEQNISRVVDDRVKNEIRSLFQRLASN